MFFCKKTFVVVQKSGNCLQRLAFDEFFVSSFGIAIDDKSVNQQNEMSKMRWKSLAHQKDTSDIVRWFMYIVEYIVVYTCIWCSAKTTTNDLSKKAETRLFIYNSYRCVLYTYICLVYEKETSIIIIKWTESVLYMRFMCDFFHFKCIHRHEHLFIFVIFRAHFITNVWYTIK